MRIQLCSVIFIALGIFLVGGSVFAQPVFSPGQTLNPDCAPGQTGVTSIISGNTGDCTVVLPTVTADNGLTDNAGIIELGGTLLDDTNIDVDGNLLSILGDKIFFTAGNNAGNQMVGTIFNDGLNSGSMISQYVPSAVSVIEDDIFIGGISRTIEDTSNNVYSQFLGLGAEYGQVQIGNENLTTGNFVRGIFDIINQGIRFETREQGNDNNLTLDQDGLTFSSDLGSYTFPRIAGPTGHVLTSDGVGNIVWEEITGTAPEQFSTEYNLAQAQSKTPYPTNESFTFPGVEQIHEIILVDDYIFGSTRSDPAKLIRVNQNDLTDYTVVDFAGEKDSERIVYDEVTGKLYQIFADVTYVDPRVAVYEIDPETLDTQIIVDHTWPTGAGAAVLDTDGEHIYAIQGNSNPYVSKFDITTGNHLGTYQITAPNETGHNIEYHEGYLFATSSFGTPFFVKIDASTMTLAQQITTPTFMVPASPLQNVITPTMIFIGEFVYIAYEFGDRNAPDASSYILRYQWNDLTIAPTVIDLGVGSGINGLAYDGQYIWTTHNDADVTNFPPTPINSYITRLDPVTLEYSTGLVDIPAIYKIRSDGQRLFVSAFPFGQDSSIHRFNSLPLFDATGIAGVVGGGRFTAEPRQGVFSFIVPDGILQRRFTIRESGVEIGDYTLPWTDGLPGQVLTTDGAGNIVWEEVNREYETNLRLSQSRNVDYVDENTKFVSLNDETFVHAFVYANGNILAGTRQNPVTNSCTLYRVEPETLDILQTISLPNDGLHQNCEKFIYVPETDRVYGWLATNSYASNEPTIIIEINPHDISDNAIFINDSTSPGTGASGALTSDGKHIFTADGNFSPRIKKFDIHTGVKVGEIQLNGSGATVDSGTLHGIETDGTHLYASTFYGETFNPALYPGKREGVHKIRISDMTYHGFADMAGFALNPQSVILGDYVYIGSEAYKDDLQYYPNSGKLLRIRKSDMSVQEIDTGFEDISYIQVSHYDGNYIYLQALEEDIGDVDLVDVIGPFAWGRFNTEGNYIEWAHLITEGTDTILPPQQNYTDLRAWPANWIDGDGTMLYGESYDWATEEYGITRFAASSFVPDFKRVILGSDMQAMQIIDYTSNTTTFIRPDNGDVIRIENTDGDCVINPNITGGIDCSSDETLKKDITLMENTQLSRIANIAPRLYRWANSQDTDQKTMGFLAQEVREVFPELVSQDSRTGLLRMSYAGLTVPLVGAVQELYTRVLALEALQDWNIGETDSLQEFMRVTLQNAGETIFKGIVRVFELMADTIRAGRIETQELCMDGVCISPEQFKQLLEFTDIDYTTSNSASIEPIDNAEEKVPEPSSQTSPDEESEESEESDESEEQSSSTSETDAQENEQESDDNQESEPHNDGTPDSEGDSEDSDAPQHEESESDINEDADEESNNTDAGEELDDTTSPEEDSQDEEESETNENQESEESAHESESDQKADVENSEDGGSDDIEVESVSQQ